MAPHWTRERVVLLIEFYKKHRFLWDPEHLNYFKNHKRDEVLEELKNSLGEDFTLYFIREKFRSLRSIYGRELKKHNMLVGAGKPFNSRWEFFERMKFIHNYITLGIKGGRQWKKLKKAKELEQNTDETDKTDENEQDSQPASDNSTSESHNVETQYIGNQLILQPGDVLVLPGDNDKDDKYNDHMDISEFLQSNHTPLENNSVHKRKKGKTVNVTVKNRSNTPVVPLNTDNDKDLPDSIEHHFAKLVASQLRAIPNPYNRDMAMLEIQQILINHKFKCS